jgi:nucleoside-diphosphate-sugar epimerase
VHVLLTGATGSLGSAILPQLLEHGHDVTAIVRSEERARRVEAAGATPVVDDLSDRPHLVYLMRESDGVIHTAATSGERAEALDRGVAEAAIEALSGSGKPYLHSGGAWVYGAGSAITEQDPYDAPAITAWRLGIFELLERADLPVTVVHPGIVYGSGRGIPGVLGAEAPRTEDGRLVTVGSGEQHWATIHVDDLAALYVAVLEGGSGFGPVLGVSGQNPRVIDLSAAAAHGAGVATEPPERTRERLGEAYADALLLDQQASGEKARSINGWAPTRPSLLEELAAS